MILRERLKADPNPILIKHVNKPRMNADNKRSFENMYKLNLAHILMLDKQEIISNSDSKIILKALLELSEKGSGEIELNPNFEDYYFNTERYIISKIGIEIGGKMHTARSRNDLHSTILRMNIRDEFFKIVPKFIKLRKELLNLAIKHSETVVTGYTHMQPAQPISIGFYFAAVAEAFERDFERLTLSYKHLNQATLGACAFAGTSFNIDRDYTASLLGFDGVVVNTLDAIASRDYILELLASFSIIGSTINRVAHDLYYWSTDEFRYIELDDSMCSTSSIMPQKKNPAVLEYIKAKSSHLLSAFVDCFTSMRGVPFGHNRDTGGESIYLLWNAFEELEAMLELTEAVVSNMKVKEEHLKERADSNFSTVTDLADELVREEKISFRAAHQIVGHVVLECVDKGLSAKAITTKQLDEAAIIFIGRPFEWDENRLKSALDSLESIHKRNKPGFPSPKQCNIMVKNMSQQLNDDELWINKSKRQQELANNFLFEQVQKTIS